ncbi:hypothetical protein SASPL_150073 [Salvia splendens]|uniref:GST C-terminal domain-containing protein n=1 Tax=Salvia splendens TaxID=180675 RepID=A0A8X8W649_SALSN|nr:hypothetical protein SASPL_150073 [Salvia splendens]
MNCRCARHNAPISSSIFLEQPESGIDYTSIHVNPIMGMNFDSRFFEKNPSRFPEWCIERIGKVTRGGEESSLSRQRRSRRMGWLTALPKLASAYHRKLKEAYDAEDKLKDPETLRRSEEHLEKILDEADEKLSQTTYLLGEEFTLADIVLVPLLSRLVLLNLKNKYVATRPRIAKYWNLVKTRPSYIKVIGRYFDGWRRHNTLFKTWARSPPLHTTEVKLKQQKNNAPLSECE